ncbi:LON peptidase substrate-binding domain-containing protein [Deinococcus yavapaiensis]|uniref:LON peptidase substrate-binding domain-containing protein n=1 Tax=Deinococcus yavapaiensis TaxID=309889 RepID=UPI00319E38D0
MTVTSEQQHERMSLPLFPLPNVVLLPGLVLPLYIFEPRYRALLARVRASGEPFGITRLLPADEARSDFESRVGLVGTLAHLREVIDHEDGTASILVVGGERFEVTAFDTTHPYLSAYIRTLPLEEGDKAVVDVLSRKVLEGVMRAHRAEEERVRESAPGDPLLLATYCTALLPLSSEQREEILRAPTLADRFEALAMWVPKRTLN